MPGTQESCQSMAGPRPPGVMKNLGSGSEPSFFQAKTPEYAAHQTKPPQSQIIVNQKNVSCVCCGRPYNVEKPYCPLCGQEYQYEGALNKHREGCNGKKTRRAIKRGNAVASTRASEANDTLGPSSSTTEDHMPQPEHRFDGSQFVNPTAATICPSENSDTGMSFLAAEDQVPQPGHRLEESQPENCKVDAATHLEENSFWSEFNSGPATPSQGFQGDMDRSLAYAPISEAAIPSLPGQDLQKPIMDGSLLDGYWYYWNRE
jgi:hypothetical protein